MACSADDAQRTYLRTQFVSVPFHISKPHWDGSVLMIQVINPTAGLFSGDELKSDIRIESGARVLMTTPSASRVHISRGGWAEARQSFHVAEDAWLEFSPAMLIPQAGGKYRHRTDIEVAAGGELFFMEILAPGRVARGECFEYEDLDWETNLRHKGKLIFRERYRLNPKNGSLAQLQRPISNAWFASCYIISDHLTKDTPAWKTIRELQSDTLMLGLSQVTDTAWSLRLLAAESVTMRKTVAAIRHGLSVNLPGLKTIPRIP